MAPHKNVVKKYVEDLGEELGKIQAHIWAECVQLHMDLAELRFLYSRKEDVDFLNAASPGFFHLFQSLLVQEIILRLCRISDPPSNRHQRNLSLRGWVDAIRESGRIVLAEKLIDKVKLFEDTLKFARKRRDKFYAHTDLETRLNPEVAPLPKITYGKMVTAIEGLGTLVNEIEGKLRQTQTYWDSDDASSRRLKMLVLRGFEQEKIDRQDRINYITRVPVNAAILWEIQSRFQFSEESAQLWIGNTVEEKLKELRQKEQN